jgi:hypothetical protein
VGSSHARFHDYSPLAFVGSERATSSLLPSCCVIIGSPLLTDTQSHAYPSDYGPCQQQIGTRKEGQRLLLLHSPVSVTED